MTDKHKERRGPGPLGTSTNNPTVDHGTAARTRNRAPGPETDAQTHAHPPPGWQSELKKTEYLAYARSVSYAMQAKSTGESTWGEAKKALEEMKKRAGIGGKVSKPDRVQSVLGGAFLRMYLDGKVDPSVTAEAGGEIGQSAEFKHLSEELNKHMQATIDRAKVHTIDPVKLAHMADLHLKSVKKSKGIAFRVTLNAVIGGVSDVAVKSTTYLGEGSTPKGPGGRYRVDITFFDVYDFENKRSGEYDSYRKELARHLAANDFEKFEDLYSREAHHPFDKKMHKTKLDNAAVFASYMYALEKKRWTPGGLAWDVTVPTEVILVPAAQHPAGHPPAGHYPAGHHPHKP